MYQALYRKYRPQTFTDVVGQRGVTETLRAQLVSGKLSHAYLFTGTRGTGKTSCAKILAKAVNCENPHDGNPCNCCAACRSIDNGSCMDVQEIDAASNNGVDSVRALRDDAVYTPSEVKMRVYIIDEVHMLSISAFNALLKIIEEPPEHLLFILATTELHKIPATILSRCQRFSFRRLTQEDIAGRLNYIAYQEGIDIEPDALQLLARLADGAMRDGASLLDQCASACTGTLTADAVARALGLAGQQKTAELLTAVADQDAARALHLFSNLYSEGKDVAALLDELCALARDLLILKTAPRSGLSMLSGPATGQEVAALCERFSGAELLRIVTMIQRTAAGFSKSANTRIDCELLFLQLCDPGLSSDAQAMNARLGRVEQAIANGVQIAQARAPAAEKPEDLDDDERAPFPDDADDPFAGLVPPGEAEASAPKPKAGPVGFWPELAERIRAELGPRERGFFSPTGPLTASLQGDTLVIAAETDFVLGIIKKPEIEALIRDKAAGVLKRPVAVRLTLKSQLTHTDSDPMDELLAFGGKHTDIFTIK